MEVAKILHLPISSVAGIRVVELTVRDEAELQQLFEDSPGYFLAVNGEPARPLEAREELNFQLPDDWPHTRMYWLGYRDAEGVLVAVVNVASDLLATGVWHIGLLLVATSLHGTGLANRLHADLQNWAMSLGARWLRLTVVQGNTRAERFWPKLGYVSVRAREGIKMGRQVNRVFILVKPLAGADIEGYLRSVSRDRPDAP
ncbi:GNAT family N-acetyltransferase [Pseudomonas fluorescens]|uniref:GNAT family N-acetyltransferase n=1 Tax=Pseudomonas fluorescens TaxID=294 RepID=UPI001BEA39BB|nr:GNAT family N-acetyltransferase [Pseudomonas fluorescens]MBT2370554.1 GNAT family N-acetyltransferase [Pseudomonas fluorescens]